MPALKEKIGNRDTKHGLLDLPVDTGAVMKKPKMRFGNGGDVADIVKEDREVGVGSGQLNLKKALGGNSDAPPPPPANAGQLAARPSKEDIAKRNASTKGLSPEQLWIMGRGPKPAGKAGGGWIKGATRNKGGLHRALGVPEGQKIPKSKIAAAAGKGGKLGKEARLAQTLSKFAGGGVVRSGINGLAARGHTKGRMI